MSEERKRSVVMPIVSVVLLLGLYAGAYYAMVDRRIGFGNRNEAFYPTLRSESAIQIPRYFGGHIWFEESATTAQRLLAGFFNSIHEVDRRLRPNHRNSPKPHYRPPSGRLDPGVPQNEKSDLAPQLDERAMHL